MIAVTPMLLLFYRIYYFNSNLLSLFLNLAQLKAAREEKEKQEKSAEPPVAAAAVSTAPSGTIK